MNNNETQWTGSKPTAQPYPACWYFWRQHADAIVNMVLIQFWNNAYPTATFMIPGCETRQENLTQFSGGEWLGPISHETQRDARKEDQYDVALALVKQEQEKQKIHHCCDGTLAGRLRTVLSQYDDVATRALGTAKEFRDRLIIDFRALSMVLTMVGNAATHKEKDARLRGTVELVDGAINKLEKLEFDIAFARQPHFEDVFRSDYPTRKFVERIRELEDQIKQMGQPAEPSTPDHQDFQR